LFIGLTFKKRIHAKKIPKCGFAAESTFHQSLHIRFLCVAGRQFSGLAHWQASTGATVGTPNMGMRIKAIGSCGNTQPALPICNRQ
jgi:hypothetical protein